MRTHTIRCDWCNEPITEYLHVYESRYLKPHATHEGARDSWDFCSFEHLLAWRDHNAMRRLSQARTHRFTGPDEESAVEYRVQLNDEVDQRIRDAMEQPRHV